MIRSIQSLELKLISLSSEIEEILGEMKHLDDNCLNESIPNIETLLETTDVKSSIKSLEAIFDRLGESILRRKNIEKTTFELQELLGECALTKQLFDWCRSKEEEETTQNNQLVTKLVALEDKLYSNEIDLMLSRRKEVNVSRKNELMTKYIMKDNPLVSNMNMMFGEYNVRLIEKWSSSKVSKIVFDTLSDEYSTSTVFFKKTEGLKKLAIFIKDSNSNIFGRLLSGTFLTSGNVLSSSDGFNFILKIGNNTQTRIKIDNNVFDYSGMPALKNQFLVIPGAFSLGKFGEENLCYLSRANFGNENLLGTPSNGRFAYRRVVVVEMV
ncbi:hypothetical protein EIN_377650 [Entamoeba invadens IP1]|uniref:TLDc domain-containing protein n=1 Tax=Entamoeba invadens IP1 TaxID=370355 RepID=A0A0A1TU95_ENTIV|nr:hypothetical protein EIN_377650 [Entamoeba invadens IP1]ELP83510.1 hypothetical protein EIN_377650 [Entamoeba invadens IP1]|eukprot:XP_004182856.1 hypothetical protein EIN_377650 [Entamoeba invadens IP1]